MRKHNFQIGDHVVVDYDNNLENTRKRVIAALGTARGEHLDYAVTFTNGNWTLVDRIKLDPDYCGQHRDDSVVYEIVCNGRVMTYNSYEDYSAEHEVLKRFDVSFEAYKTEARRIKLK